MLSRLSKCGRYSGTEIFRGGSKDAGLRHASFPQPNFFWLAGLRSEALRALITVGLRF